MLHTLYIILLVILGFFLVLVSVCYISDKITDWQFEKLDTQRTLIEQRLTESLKSLCNQLGIELTYHKELGTAAGKILYHEQNGRLLVDEARIQILEKYQDEPWTLAHELGHYMSIKSQQDSSEEFADKEADKLCRSILTKKEQELLSIPLRCYFHQNNQEVA